MRILWNEATDGPPELDPLWEALRRYFKRVARPDVEVTMRHLPVSANFVRSLYTELLNNKQVVEGAIWAEKEGFDAVVLGCWADPLWEAREVVDIPVVGIGEAAMLLATMLGQKFAIVTVAPGVIPTIEIDLKLYGLESRAIVNPVRALDPPSDAQLLVESVSDPFKEFIPRFEKVARECIADGAGVIAVGCGYYGPILSLHGYHQIEGTGVPVVDCSAAGLKMAESLADLRRTIGLSKSAALYYRKVPAETLDRVRQVHNL